MPTIRSLLCFAVALIFCLLPASGQTHKAGMLDIEGDWSAQQNFKNANNIRYADQFSGADAGAKIAAAIADLPATGGTVDARGLEGAQTISTDVFSGVTKAVTLILTAAFTVNANATVLNNFTILYQNGGSLVAGGSYTLTNNANNIVIGGPPTFANTGNHCTLQGGTNGGTIAQFSSSGAGSYTQDATCGIINVPGTATVSQADGVSGIVENHSSNVYSMGGFFQTHQFAAGKPTWSINTVGWLFAGADGDTLQNEVDFDNNANNSIIYGWSIQAPQWDVAPYHSAGISLGKPGGASGAKWTNFLESADGATLVGLNLGTNATGNSVGSQAIQLKGRDSGGTNHTASIATDGNGNLYLTPPSPAYVIANSPLKSTGNLTVMANTILGAHGATWSTNILSVGSYDGTNPDLTSSSGDVHGVAIEPGISLTGNVNQVSGMYLEADIDVASGKTLNGAYGLYISGVNKTGPGTIGKAWGLAVNAPTVGSTANYAAQFNGKVAISPVSDPTHDLEVTGTAAVSKSFVAGFNVVTFSATPTFDASLANTFKITLTGSPGNVTSSTLSNATAGQQINFVICQDSAGSHTFVWPTNILGGMTIGSTASKCSAQAGIFDGTNLYMLSAGVINM